MDLANFSLRKPDRVFLWFPEVCNLNCTHCSIGKNTRLGLYEENKLSVDNMRLILNKLDNWIGKKYALSFIAGEPFFHKNILEFISCAKKSLAITSVTSNGTLINNSRIARDIVNSGLDYIALSIDGWFGSSIHDLTRGGTKNGEILKAVINAVNLLKVAKENINSNTPKIFVNSIIMRDNLSDLVKIVEWSKNENLDGITFQPIASDEFFNGKDNFNWFRISNLWPDFHQVSSFLDFLMEKKNSGYPVKNSKNDFLRFKRYFKNPIDFAKSEVCGVSSGLMTIVNDGTIKICPGLGDGLGNILTDDLNTIWRCRAAFDMRYRVSNCKFQCKILANNKKDFYFL